jgi:hypothetical protein
MSLKRQLVTTLANLIPDFWINQLHNPIFIIGTARSGTSLLVRVIGMHPDIANWSEANVVWDPTGYPSAPHVAPDWVDPYVFNERWWQDTQSRLKEIPAMFGLFQTVKRKPYFLNKSPFNTFRIPHILQLFPQAKFINITRHGLAVVNSRLYKERDFVSGMPYRFKGDETVYDFETTALRFARLWKLSVEEVIQQDNHFRLAANGRLLNISYEQFCEQPEATLQTIQHYLGVAKPIEMNEVIENNNDKWKENIPLALAEKLIDEMQPTFSAQGYSL